MQPSFVLHADTPGVLSHCVQCLCVLVACGALWRFELATPVVLLTALIGGVLIGYGYKMQQRGRMLKLCVLESGAFTVFAAGEPCDARIVFALCTSHSLTLKAQVDVDGRKLRQEWSMNRTDNEVLWRSACRWVKWLNTQGETKKRH